MITLFETSAFYVVTSLAMYLAAKGLALLYIWRKVTVRKTRNILLTLAILFSPTVMTIALLFNSLDVVSYACYLPVIGYFVDWGIVRWVRAIFEPVKTLDDLKYDPDITNVDIP